MESHNAPAKNVARPILTMKLVKLMEQLGYIKEMFAFYKVSCIKKYKAKEHYKIIISTLSVLVDSLVHHNNPKILSAQRMIISIASPK